jgi:hypothetical protein
MIIFEDFHIDPEKMQEINYRERLSCKEVSLLLGLLIKAKINFDRPDSNQELIQLKKKTYEILEELHNSFLIPFTNKMQKSLESEHKKEDFRKEQKEFFGNGNMLTEAIFYSGPDVYDFQYLDFLDKKYKYDKEWLKRNKKFEFDQVTNIVIKIRGILNEKAKKIHLYYLKEEMPKIIEKIKKKYPKEDWVKYAKEMLPMAELHQYVELFFGSGTDKNGSTLGEIGPKNWDCFYKELIDLFVVRKTDLSSFKNIDAFFSNFSICQKENNNPTFHKIGNYNLINSRPIIKLDEDRYFVPVPFLVFEAIYENPFYWMANDDKYRVESSKNRGKVGEEIAYDFLLKVFGPTKTFKSVKIKNGYNDVTDIDVLCVLGSKALCVQVKSKKLTELSRTGNDEQLQKDFQGAVQDAFEQGLTSRQQILKRGALFIDENGKEMKLSEDIDDAYIIVTTTENYPALAFQAHTMLEKKDSDPFPMVLTVFDLEMVAHYLNDPYEFLYYVKQRTSLMDYFLAQGEMAFLGYHLCRNLFKVPNHDFVAIDPNYAQLIDRNYFPLKAGIAVSDEGDLIKSRWGNEDFDLLCDQLKKIHQPKITDIVFHLYDCSGNARDSIVKTIKLTKERSLTDGKIHNFSIQPDKERWPCVGVSYVSIFSNESTELNGRLFSLCRARKYRSKGDIWIGFGSYKDSDAIIDTVVFNDQKWEQNEELEKFSDDILGKGGQIQHIGFVKKAGRNDKCPCGSGIKYKKCCGREDF